MDPQRLKQRAEKQFSRGKWQKALADFLRLSEKEPADLRIRTKIAETLLRLGRQSEAQIILRQVADLYTRDGQLHKAIAVNHRLLELDRDDREIQAKLAGLYERHQTGTKKDLPLGPHELNETVQLLCGDQLDEEIKTLNETTRQARRRSDWKKALETAIRLWQIQPANPDVRMEIAAILLAMDRAKEAVEVYYQAAQHFLRQTQPLRALFVQTKMAEIANGHPASPLPKWQELAKRIAILYASYGERHWQARSKEMHRHRWPTPFKRLRPRREIMEEMLEDILVDPVDLNSIQPVPLLSELPRSACEALIQWLKPRTLPKGEVLFQDQEIADSLFFLTSGRVGLYNDTAGDPASREVPAQVIEEGELVGEIGFLLDRRHHCSAVAQTEVEALELTRTHVQALCAETKEIEAAFDRLFLQRVLPGLLRQNPFFSVQSNADLTQLAAAFETERYSEGRFSIQAGTPCDRVFLVREGVLDLFWGRLFEKQAVCTLKPGMFFGLREWLTEGIWPYAFRASGPVVLVTLSWQNLDPIWVEQLREPQRVQQLLQKHPDLTWDSA